MHSRRRRTTRPPSEPRESITLSLSCPQKGHCMKHLQWPIYRRASHYNLYIWGSKRQIKKKRGGSFWQLETWFCGGPFHFAKPKIEEKANCFLRYSKNRRGHSPEINITHII